MAGKLSSRAKGLIEFLRFLWRRKLYWLIPLIILLLIFIVIIITAETTGLGPLIYPLI